MPLVGPSIALVLFWVLIHGIYRFLKPSKLHALLPSTSVSVSRGRRGLWNSTSTQVVLKAVHLRVQTTAWNLRHDILAATLRKDRKASWALRWFYDLGCFLGILGMSAGFSTLVWTCAQALYILVEKTLPHTPQAPGLVRRIITSHPLKQIPSQRSTFLKPIIPGVTVPLGHLPLILSAVFLAQIVHELGHALAAALESIPLLSAGASFTLILPSAFVTFPNASLEVLPPRARGRIISAGAFHNIFFWAILMLVQSIGAGDAFWSIGYRNVFDVGRVVVSVDVDSPLYVHLPPGSMVTMLDDTSLGSTNALEDVWSSYLAGSISYGREELGWCTEHELDNSEQCCDTKSVPGLMCFRSGDSRRWGCLDPVPILTSSEKVNRCNVDSDCFENSTCVRPDRSNRLLRLSVFRPWNGASEVVLWSGPLEEVLREVHVGVLLPKLSLMPVWLPGEARLFWQYLLMGTLSLFFFNLLPIPYLDGSQFLQNILEVVFDDHTADTVADDVEAIEARQNFRWRGRWREVLSRVIPRITVILFTLCVLLGVIDVLW